MSSNTATTAPSWGPQLTDLTTAFNDANGALTNAQGATAPTGTSSSTYQPEAATVGSNGGALSTAGTDATTSGLSKLTNFNPSSTNNVDSVTSAAQKYAAGQNIAGEVAAGMQPAVQQATEVTIPGITQNAGTTGNSDSSRTGIAQGMVQQGLAEQAEGLYNTDYNQAYENGLNLAENQDQANNNGVLTAAEGATSGGTNAASTGTNAVSSGITDTGNANTNDENNFTNSVGNNYTALQDFYNLIGANNWGSTTTSNGTSESTGTGTSTTESNPSALSLISSLLSGGGSAATGVAKLMAL